LGREPIRERLTALGLTVELHDDHFAPDEKDQVWLGGVARRGWVVLTKDARIRYRPLERMALQESGARVFVLTAGNLGREDIARTFVEAMPEMQKILAKEAGGFVAHVTAAGRVRVVR
jgi:predicted nuclease of predicted toxin-antitoxin system